MKRMIIASLSISLLAGAAVAQSQIEPVNVRESKVEGRIDQGSRNGTLTGPEVQQLRAEYRAIVQLEADFRKSGGIDATERATLTQRLSALDASIKAEKEDGETNPNR